MNYQLLELQEKLRLQTAVTAEIRRQVEWGLLALRLEIMMVEVLRMRRDLERERKVEMLPRYHVIPADIALD